MAPSTDGILLQKVMALVDRLASAGDRSTGCAPISLTYAPTSYASSTASTGSTSA
jgi:hypothetical protein